MNRFLILFAAIAGLSLATSVKEDLLRRCNNSYTNVNLAVADNIRRGFDYFAEVLNETLIQVEYARTSIGILPDNLTAEQAHQYAKEVEDIERMVANHIRIPAPREIYKSGALYFATMKEIGNDITKPKIAELKRAVADIILQEGYVKSFGQTPGVETLRDAAKKTLDQMYEALVNNIKDGNIPTPEHFALLEYDMHLKIQDLKNHNKHEEMKKCEEALSTFQTATYYVAKIFPIDSRTRMNQFLQAAPEHYKDYLALKVLFWVH